jgi:hypothetical protein
MIGFGISVLVLLVMVRVVMGDETDLRQCFIWIGSANLIGWLISLILRLKFVGMPDTPARITGFLLAQAALFYWLWLEYHELGTGKVLLLYSLYAVLVLSIITLMLLGPLILLR